MKILGIIPARGESKSIPHKNLKLLGGKPLIAWSIESALSSNVDKLIVTTESLEIARIARKYGAEVPFLRPKKLAGDNIAMEPVLKHAIQWLKKNKTYEPDGVALLQSTCPLRKKQHINKGISLFFKKIKEGKDSIISVSEAIANQNPEWMLKYDKNRKIILGNGETLLNIKNRRQELSPCYYRNDIIYLFKPEVLYSAPNIHGNNPELYVVKDLPFELDINTPEDWNFAEVIFEWLKINNKLI